MEDFPSLELSGEEPIWCEGCQRRQKLIDEHEQEKSLNYKTLKQKIVSTDLLIKKFRSKCEEYDQQSKMLQDVTRKLERAKRDTETLDNQLQNSLKQMEPLRNENDSMKGVMIKKDTEIDMWKTKVLAADKLRAQYEAFGHQNDSLKSKLDRYEKERKVFDKKIDSLESNKQKQEKELNSLKDSNKILKQEKKLLEKKLEKNLQIQQQHLNLLKQNDLLTKRDKRLRNSLVKQNQCSDDYIEDIPFEPTGNVSVDKYEEDLSFKEIDLDLMFTMSPLVIPLSPLPLTPQSHQAEESSNDSINDCDMIEIPDSDIHRQLTSDTDENMSTWHKSPNKQLLSQSVNKSVSEDTQQSSISTESIFENSKLGVFHKPLIHLLQKEDNNITQDRTMSAIIKDTSKTLALPEKSEPSLIHVLETENAVMLDNEIAEPLPVEDKTIKEMSSNCANETQSSLDNKSIATVLQPPDHSPHSPSQQNVQNSTVLIPLEPLEVKSSPLLNTVEEQLCTKVINIDPDEHVKPSSLTVKQSSEKIEMNPCVTNKIAPKISDKEKPIYDSEPQNSTIKAAQVEVVSENSDQDRSSSNICSKQSQVDTPHTCDNKKLNIVHHSQAISTIEAQNLSSNRLPTDKTEFVQQDLTVLNELSISPLKSEPNSSTDQMCHSVENNLVPTNQAQTHLLNSAESNTIVTAEPQLKTKTVLTFSAITESLTKDTNQVINPVDVEHCKQDQIRPQLKTKALSDLPNKTEPVTLKEVHRNLQSEFLTNKIEPILIDDIDCQPDHKGGVGKLECSQDKLGVSAVMASITVADSPEHAVKLDSVGSVNNEHTQICGQSKLLSSHRASLTHSVSEVIVMEDDMLKAEKHSNDTGNELSSQPADIIPPASLHCSIEHTVMSPNTETTISASEVAQRSTVDCERSFLRENSQLQESTPGLLTEHTKTTHQAPETEIKLKDSISQSSLPSDSDLCDLSFNSNSDNLLKSEDNEPDTSIIRNSAKKKKKNAKKRKRKEEINSIHNNDFSDDHENSNSDSLKLPKKAKKVKIPTFSDPSESSKSVFKPVMMSQKSTGFTISEISDNLVDDSFTINYSEPSCSKKYNSECDILETIFKSGDILPNIRLDSKIDSLGNSPSLRISPFNFLDIMNPISPLPPSPEPSPSNEMNVDDTCLPSLEDMETTKFDFKSRLLNSAVLSQPVQHNCTISRITTTRPMDQNTCMSDFPNPITVPQPLGNSLLLRSRRISVPNEKILKKTQISSPATKFDFKQPSKSDLVMGNVLRRSMRTKSREAVKTIVSCDKDDSNHISMEVVDSSVGSYDVMKDEDSEQTNMSTKSKLMSKFNTADDLPDLSSNKNTGSPQIMESDLEKLIMTSSEEIDSFILKHFSNNPLQNWFLLVQAILNVLKKTKSSLTTRSSEDVNRNPTEAHAHQPLLFHTETNLLVLLQNIFSQYSMCSDSVLLNLLLNSVIKDGLNLPAKAALCRIFVGLCRLKGDLEQGRVMAYEIMFHICACNNENGPMLVLAIAGVWPLIFDSKFPTANVIVHVMEHVVMTITEGYRYTHSKIFNSISEICGWRLVLPTNNNKLVCEKVIQYLKQATDDNLSDFKGNIFEGMAALKLLFKKENWHFFFLEFINRYVSSACQKWTSKAENSDITPQYIESIINVLGDVNLVEKEPEVHKINMAMKLYLMPTLNKPSEIKSVSLIAADTMMKLSPLAPQMTCSYLITWFRKHKHEIPAETKMQLQQTRQYLLEKFANFNCAEFV